MVKMTPQLAEICGIHAGDGYLRLRNSSKGELDISGNIEEKGYYDNYVIPLFNDYFNLKLKGKTFSRGTYGFVIYNKCIAQFFNEIGFPYGEKSSQVETPKLILNSNTPEISSAFLRGLFDTDGCISFRKSYGEKYKEFKRNYHHYPTIRLSTISNKLADNICFLLNQLKIKYFKWGTKPKKLEYHYIYSVIISGRVNVHKWMNIIGSKNPVKLSRFDLWKKFGFCQTNTTLNEREDILKNKNLNIIKGPIVQRIE